MKKDREKRVNLLVETMNDPNVLKELGVKELPTSGSIGILWDLRKEPGVNKGIFKGGFTREFSTKDDLVRSIAEFTEAGRNGYGSITFILQTNGESLNLEVNDKNGVVFIDEKDALAILAWAGGNKDVVTVK